MIDILFFYFIMASLFVFGKKACLYFSPLQLTGIRLLIMGLLFLAFALFKKQVDWKRIPTHAWLFIGMITSAIVSDLFRFVSLTVLPASHSALLTTTSPLIAAFISYFVFKERITLQKAAALALGIVGILPLILHNLALLPASSSDVMLKGYGCAFLSTIGFITVGVFIKKLGQAQYPLFTTLGVSLTGAGSFCMLLGLLTQTDFLSAYSISYSHLPVLILPSMIGYPLYGYLVCAYPLTLVAFAQLSSPLWAALISWFHGSNDISLPFLLSFFVLVVAFIMFYSDMLKRKKQS